MSRYLLICGLLLLMGTCAESGGGLVRKPLEDSRTSGTARLLAEDGGDDEAAAADSKEAEADDSKEGEGDGDDEAAAADSEEAKADDSDDEAAAADGKDAEAGDGKGDEAAGDKEGKAELSKPGSGFDFQLLKEIAIPVVAFIIGAALHMRESTAVFGKLAMFFGAQTVMNLYMKQVLSGAVVDEEAGLHGIPSAFIVTAIQQLVAFICFGLVLMILYPCPCSYRPKTLETPMEWLAVILFSFSFTLNIALNNFSISLLPLSVNLIIRSCLPLATFISQRTASQCTNEPIKDARAIEIGLMCLGVACAAVAVVAQTQSGGGDSDDYSKTLVFGIVICVASLFSGAINLALAGVLGTSCKLNSLDTTVYMSVPAFMFLIIPSLFYWHPVAWPGYGNMSDWEIFCIVLDKKPSVVWLACFSGVLALFYNVFQYGIVHSLSASYTAFAGNFNKAATIAIGILVGLEALPPGKWGIIMVLAVLGNIGAFTAFNIVKIKAAPTMSQAKQSEEAAKDASGAPPDEKKELIGDKA